MTLIRRRKNTRAFKRELVQVEKQLFRAMADTYESFQKERIRAENRLRNILKGLDEEDPLRIKLLTRLKELKKVEDAIKRDCENALRGIPVYEEFLSKVKGVGNIYAIKLLSLPLKLGEHLSSWNAYFGLTPHYWMCKCKEGHRFLYPREVVRCPVEIGFGEERQRCNAPVIEVKYVENEAPRRKRGYHAFWNPKARRLVFLISKNFVMLGDKGFYGRAYRRFKQRILWRRDIEHLPRIRKEAMARRATFKLFLAHFYQAYHDLEGNTLQNALSV